MKQIKYILFLIVGLCIGTALCLAYAEVSKNRAIADAITQAGLCVVFKQGRAEIIPCAGYCDPRVNKFCSILKPKITEVKK